MKKLTYILTFVFISFFSSVFSQTIGTLNFSMKTATPSGSYGSNHLLAIWIENSSGTFVKTMVKYAATSKYDHLATWTGKSGKNLVDATSGATLTTNGTITFNWNGTDVNKTQVTDGSYKIWVELAWDKSLTTGKVTTSFSFNKTSAAEHLTPANISYISAVVIDWQPTPTLSTSALTASSFCAGSTLKVPFSVSGGSFSAGNIFTAQLSNSSGSFASPVSIGTLTATTSDSITATIPVATLAGTAYRIRVASSNPAALGTDNGTNLSISAVTPVTVTNISGVLNSSATTGNQWYEKVTGIISGANANTYTPTANGDYYTIVKDLQGCSATSNTIHFVMTAINEMFSNKNISVYPNPTDGLIYIKSNTSLNNCSVRVENLTGSKVFDKKLNIGSGITTIDLTRNANAVYNIIINQNGKELRYRIVLNR